MSGHAHPDGICTCVSHVDRPWNRPEHWTSEEVFYLEAEFGIKTDAAIAKHLGRTMVGIRLKAKRLGLHKRDVGMSSRDVARIFGVDETTVSKSWIRHGALRARRASFKAGRNRMWVVSEDELERFLRDEAHWFDPDRMPDETYRGMALAGGRWLSLADVGARTGRHAHILAKEVHAGRWPARKRGAHWMVHEATIPAIAATAGYNGRLASLELREAKLARRRNVRKGIETPRHHEPRILTYRVVDCPQHAGDECLTCEGKGLVLSARLRGAGIQPLPEAWAA